MLTFWSNWCLYPGAAEDRTYEDSTPCPPTEDMGAGLAPYNFNQQLNNIDIYIYEENVGAVGIVMLAAQGSGLEEVTVYAAEDALAGIHGGNGGGGSFVGVRVHGAKYGLDASLTAGFATIVAVTLEEQVCAGLIIGSSVAASQHSHSTFTATGLYVLGSPILGGILAGLSAPSNSSDLCFLPKMPGGWMQPPYYPQSLTQAATQSLALEQSTYPQDRQLTQEDRQLAHEYNDLLWMDRKKKASSGKEPKVALFDALSLVDSVVAVYGGAACIQANGSLWVSEFYATGCAAAVVAGGVTMVKGASMAGDYIHLVSAAIPRQDWTDISNSPYSYSFTIVSDGESHTSPMLEQATDVSSVPLDLQAKHIWAESNPDWQSPGAVFSSQIGAIGDGIIDDWFALQQAADKYPILVLEAGLYRLSQPLVLRQDQGALVGVGNARSFLMPTTQGFSPPVQPVLDVTAASVTLKGLTVVSWDHLMSYTLHWQGTNGIFRQSFINREHEAAFTPFEAFPSTLEHPPPESTPINLNRSLSVISGGGKFYNFNLDFGCCFGTVVAPPPAQPGPGIASTSQILLQPSAYRSLLVNYSKSGLGFYPLNMEQSSGDAHTEIAFSSNVTAFGAKSENNHVVIWIHDSDFITVHGKSTHFIVVFV